MSDFDEGLAIGLLLGRRGGGGGSDTELIKEVDENAMHLFTHKIDDEFSFEVKFWVPGMKNGELPVLLPETLTAESDYPYGTAGSIWMTTSRPFAEIDGETVFAQVFGFLSRYPVLPLLMKKNGEILYMLLNCAGTSTSGGIGEIERYSGIGDAAYKRYRNMKISRFNYTYGEDPELTPSTGSYVQGGGGLTTGVQGYYTSSMSVRLEVTADEYYGYADESGEFHTAKRPFEYSLGTSISLSRIYYIPNDFSCCIYSGLTKSGLFGAFMEIANACRTEAGIKSFIPRILEPD